MKTLYLVRHAKSDWKIDEIKDMDRPLNSRGYRDAYSMSRLMAEKKLLLDLIISSPAIRAISTALIFSRDLKIKASEIVIRENLYETSVKDYLDVIKQTDNKYNSIMLFGHNPIISDLASHLITPLTENLSTCAIAGIRFPKNCKEWKNMDKNSGELILFDFPKNHE